MSMDDRLGIIEGVLSDTAMMMGMSPVFKPQAQMLKLCAEETNKIRQELRAEKCQEQDNENL